MEPEIRQAQRQAKIDKLMEKALKRYNDEDETAGDNEDEEWESVDEDEVNGKSGDDNDEAMGWELEGEQAPDTDTDDDGQDDVRTACR